MSHPLFITSPPFLRILLIDRVVLLTGGLFLVAQGWGFRNSKYLRLRRGLTPTVRPLIGICSGRKLRQLYQSRLFMWPQEDLG
jgi:hypothetical protein